MTHNPLLGLYQSKTLACLEQAFNAAWPAVQARYPLRDQRKDNELRVALGHKLMVLVAKGVDPEQLRKLVMESFPLAA